MSNRDSKRPELLAPAGGQDSLRAAIANGADAVYLGAETFNARQGADNFTLDSLAEACAFAHLRGRKVYLTANVVVLPDEMGRALDLIASAWAAGVDAAIIQDLGLLWAVHRELPDVRVHASTQMNAHNTPTAEALAAAGVRRVTLAREVSLEEIATLSKASVEIETFVHGALCVCYSGQCLMSSLVGRRSANRGMCAQPCRLPYDLLDERANIAETVGAHLLSPKDLAAITVLDRLVNSGVSALKIEGRMKSPEYVALVTRTYRVALDRASATSERYATREGELSVLSESFSRGFSEAYLVEERGNDMMSYRRPNNRGVFIGRVIGVDGSRATIALEMPLEALDTIEFWTAAGRFAQVAGDIITEGGVRSNAPAGAKVALQLSEAVSTGDRVFRVRNAMLCEAAARSFADPDAIAPIELGFTARVVVGRPLRVDVTDESGRSGTAEGPVVNAARTKAINADEIAEHLGRLGGTPYRIGHLELELSPGVGLGFSALHRARRDALASYERRVLSPWSSRPQVKPRVPQPTAVGVARRLVRLVAAVADERAGLACLAAGADAVHAPIAALGRVRRLPDRIDALLPRICHDREVDAGLAWAGPGERIVVGNLGLVAKAAGRGATVEAHWSLNALNAQAVAQLADFGAAFVWLSPELTAKQIATVVAASPLPIGIAVSGRQELMVTEHCVLMAEGPCNRVCGTCDRRSRRNVLRDRKGYEFPVMTDCLGRSHVFNAVALDLTRSLSDVVATGVAAVRVDVETEDAEAAASAVRMVRTALDRAALGVEPAGRQRTGEASTTTTSGHYYRGVF